MASLSQGKPSHLIAGPVVKEIILSTIQFLANLYSITYNCWQKFISFPKWFSSFFLEWGFYVYLYEYSIFNGHLEFISQLSLQLEVTQWLQTVARGAFGKYFSSG